MRGMPDHHLLCSRTNLTFRTSIVRFRNRRPAHSPPRSCHRKGVLCPKPLTVLTDKMAKPPELGGHTSLWDSWGPGGHTPEEEVAVAGARVDGQQADPGSNHTFATYSLCDSGQQLSLSKPPPRRQQEHLPREVTHPHSGGDTAGHPWGPGCASDTGLADLHRAAAVMGLGV